MQRSDVGQTHGGFHGNKNVDGATVNAALATVWIMRERNNVGAGTAACLAVQSFLALSTAITVGPLASVSRRQISLGLLFTTVGILTALLQAVIGGISFRWSRKTGTAESVICWDLLLGILLPLLLVGFWIALGVWVLYAS
jgi:hypothetical protein